VLQQIVNGIDFGMNPAEAASQRAHHQWTPDELRVEKGFSPDTIKLLKDKGQNVVIKPSMGRTQTIQVQGSELWATPTRATGRQDAGVLSPAPSPSSPPPGGLFHALPAGRRLPSIKDRANP
jgi:gamma-glutamyltranspeptidase